jgi:hypothetical protein
MTTRQPDESSQLKKPMHSEEAPQSETPILPEEASEPGKRTLSDAEIDNYLALMTKMNNRSYQMDKLDQHTRTMTVFLYTGALHWLTRHNVSFKYDSKQRRYVRC